MAVDARQTPRARTPAAHAQLRSALGHASAGRYAMARSSVAAALALAPDDAVTLVVAGLVLYVARDYREALAALRRASSTAAGTRAYWLLRERAGRLGWDREAVEALAAGAAAEPHEPRWHAALLAAYVRNACWDRAVRHGEATVALAPDFASPWLELAAAYAGAGARAAAFAAIDRALALDGAAVLALEAASLARGLGDLDAARRYAREALARGDATGLAAAVLASLDGASAPPADRMGADALLAPRRLLDRVRIDAPDAVLDALGALADAAPSDAARAVTSDAARAARCDLFLWLGRAAEAEATLAPALARAGGARPFWVGPRALALDVLAGRLDRALASVPARDAARTPGEATGDLARDPTARAWLGAALRRAERPGEAEALLAAVPGGGGAAVGARLERALLALSADDAGAARAHVAAVADRAPALLADAARALGRPLLDDGGLPREREPLRALAEAALASQRGNRDATVVSHVDPEGHLRLAAAGAAGDVLPHDRDAADLELARRLLDHGLALLRQPGRAGPARRPTARPAPPAPARTAADAPCAPRPPRVLDDAGRRAFVERGFVLVRGCLPRPLVDDWVRTVRARVEADPARTVQFDPTRHRGPAPARLDFDEPATWPIDVAVVPGERTFPIEATMPRFWGALCDLLEGAPIDTRVLTDHVILRVPWVGPPPPPEDVRTGWHLDDPSPTATLHGLRNGLLALVLLSDVEPGGGATCIVPGSHHAVARLLARRGTVDLTDRALGPAIAAASEEALECTGAAGDVYFAHPLMVHCGSVNFSSRMRWLSNPNIAVRASLDPRGRSPVEQVLALALEAASPSS